MTIEIQYRSPGEDEGTAFELIQTTVGYNLGSALHHLRREEPLVLWADAVCIDQQNEEEKTDQVQLMFDIYKRSVETIIWLGPSGNYTQAAMSTIAEIGAEFSKFHFADFPGLSASSFASMQPKQTENKRGSIPDLLFTHFKSLLNQSDPVDDAGQSLQDFFAGLEKHIAKAGQDEISPVLTGLRDLWSRDWWYRVWVIQEYVAPQQIRFFCGYDHVPSDRMWLVATLYRTYADKFINQTLAGEDGRHRPAFTAYDFPKLIEFRYGRRGQVLGCSLESILRTVHGSVQFQPPADPRDNVYALLGLADGTLSIIPDYSRSERDVLVDVTRQILLSKTGIRNLVCCNPPRSSSDSPSFVIDWPNISDSLFYLLDHVGLQNFEQSANISFMTASPSNSKVSSWQLRLTGSILGVVHDVTTSLGAVEKQIRHTCGENIGEYDLKARLWQEWIKVSYTFFHNLPPGFASVDAMKATEDIVAIFANSMGITNRQELRQAVTVVLRGDPEHAIRSWSHRVWLSRIDILYRYRSPEARLFISSEGIFGHVTAPVEPKDQLMVFYGCAIPFIVRKKNHETYQIVGPCVLPQLLRDNAALGGLVALVDKEFILV